MSPSAYQALKALATIERPNGRKGESLRTRSPVSLASALLLVVGLEPLGAPGLLGRLGRRRDRRQDSKELLAVFGFVQVVRRVGRGVWVLLGEESVDLLDAGFRERVGGEQLEASPFTTACFEEDLHDVTLR